MAIISILSLIKSIINSADGDMQIRDICDTLKKMLSMDGDGNYVVPTSKSDYAQFSNVRFPIYGSDASQFDSGDDFMAVVVMTAFRDINSCVFKIF